MKQKIFKSLFMMAAVMAMCVTLFSCQKDEITVSTSYYPEVDVDKHYLDFKAGEDTKTVKVSSQEDWAYTVDEDWLHVSRDGNGNKLTIQVDANRTKGTRECVLTVFALNDNKKKAEVKVSQLISEIETVTLESEAQIVSARIQYDALSDEQKAKVENYQDLVNAELELVTLKQQAGSATPTDGTQVAPEGTLPQE